MHMTARSSVSGTSHTTNEALALAVNPTEAPPRCMAFICWFLFMCLMASRVHFVPHRTLLRGVRSSRTEALMFGFVPPKKASRGSSTRKPILNFLIALSNCLT